LVALLAAIPKLALPLALSLVLGYLMLLRIFSPEVSQEAAETRIEKALQFEQQQIRTLDPFALRQQIDLASRDAERAQRALQKAQSTSTGNLSQLEADVARTAARVADLRVEAGRIRSDRADLVSDETQQILHRPLTLVDRFNAFDRIRSENQAIRFGSWAIIAVLSGVVAGPSFLAAVTPLRKPTAYELMLRFEAELAVPERQLQYLRASGEESVAGNPIVEEVEERIQGARAEMEELAGVVVELRGRRRTG